MQKEKIVFPIKDMLSDTIHCGCFIYNTKSRRCPEPVEG